MNNHDKHITRFTFDCPSDLHSTVKMKALAVKQSVKDYLIGLIIKDISANPPQFIDKISFEDHLKTALEKDKNLMKKLTDR